MNRLARRTLQPARHSEIAYSNSPAAAPPAVWTKSRLKIKSASNGVLSLAVPRASLVLPELQRSWAEGWDLICGKYAFIGTGAHSSHSTIKQAGVDKMTSGEGAVRKACTPVSPFPSVSAYPVTECFNWSKLLAISEEDTWAATRGKPVVTMTASTLPEQVELFPVLALSSESLTPLHRNSTTTNLKFHTPAPARPMPPSRFTALHVSASRAASTSTPLPLREFTATQRRSAHALTHLQRVLQGICGPQQSVVTPGTTEGRSLVGKYFKPHLGRNVHQDSLHSCNLDVTAAAVLHRRSLCPASLVRHPVVEGLAHSDQRSGGSLLAIVKLSDYRFAAVEVTGTGVFVVPADTATMLQVRAWMLDVCTVCVLVR